MTSALACVSLAVHDKLELDHLVTSAHQAIGETTIFGDVLSHAGKTTAAHH